MVIERSLAIIPPCWTWPSVSSAFFFGFRAELVAYRPSEQVFLPWGQKIGIGRTKGKFGAAQRSEPIRGAFGGPCDAWWLGRLRAR